MNKHTHLIICGVLLIVASVWASSYVGFHCAAWAKFPSAFTMLMGFASGFALIVTGAVNLIKK